MGGDELSKNYYIFRRMLIETIEFETSKILFFFLRIKNAFPRRVITVILVGALKMFFVIVIDAKMRISLNKKKYLINTALFLKTLKDITLLDIDGVKCGVFYLSRLKMNKIINDEKKLR